MDFGLFRRVCTLWCFCAFAALYYPVMAQEKLVAITMDDMPFNSMPSGCTLDESKAINTELLHKIKENKTPVAIFIVGRGCVQQDRADERLQILKDWTDNPWITPGSHTVTHPDCSRLTLADFQQEITGNEEIIRTAIGNRSLRYFRFPFNSLGKDSLDQTTKNTYLTERGYTVTPFTIESSDYIFDALYNEALRKGDSLEAVSLARQYIDFTIQSFEYFESLSMELFGRNIRHIYLCHANRLNTDYYNELIAAIRHRGYQCISLDEALADTVYTSPNYYYQRYGISWLYRWVQDGNKRKTLLKNSPDPAPELYSRYKALDKE